MFLEHFGLIEQPFGVTPDPRFLHMGPKHREALASLVYGTETNRGFLALIAQPGMGKTSLLYQYLEGLRNKSRAAFIFQTDCDSEDFIRHILIDLTLDSGKDLPTMHAMLNEVLLAEMRAGRRFILVIDEAQNLNERVLESVRLLSNFETPWMKLMQIVIAGQPQLAERLTRPSMAQLRQRISSVIRIDPFTPGETNDYIDHRLWVAGYSRGPLFTVGARLMIAKQSGGIPRNINRFVLTRCPWRMAWAARRWMRRWCAKRFRTWRLERCAPRSSGRRMFSRRGVCSLPRRRLSLLIRVNHRCDQIAGGSCPRWLRSARYCYWASRRVPGGRAVFARRPWTLCQCWKRLHRLPRFRPRPLCPQQPRRL